MKMDKKTIMLIVLMVVVVIVVVRAILPSGKKPVPPPVTAKTATPSTSSQGSGAAMLAEKIRSLPANAYETHIAMIKESDIAFQKNGFKNPMTPVKDESEKMQSWAPTSVGKEPVVALKFDAEILAIDDSIEGIVWNDKDPLALINNQVVGIGEELKDGAVVTQITRDTVRFSRDGKRYYLVLREE